MAEAAFSQLETDYCPPLDPALLSAIISDFDLGHEDGVQQAREILDQLKESALLEEAAGFDPSGTGAHDGDERSKRAESCPETTETTTTETDVTSLSNDISSLDLDEHWHNENVALGSAEDLEALDEESKVKLLQDVFGDRVSKYSVQHTLKKCDGKWQATMEELLNHVYFNEAEDSEDGKKLAVKGVDAFFEGQNGTKRGRKGKAKGRRVRSLDEIRDGTFACSPSRSPGPTTNKWKTAEEDVDFIASRTRIAIATVSSVYYDKGASIPRTIGELLKMSMEESKHIVSDDAAVAKHARELGYDFPSVAPHYLATIVRLSYPSTSSAHELAEALTAKPRGMNGGIQIIPQYASPLLTVNDSSHGNARKSRSAGTSHLTASDDLDAATRANAYASARATAFSQASAAHRKAKSNHLMGGAAAYYSQEARNYGALGSSASAAAADQLAAAQSTSTQLDLHGVDVLNGVRIAQERVEGWWYSLGESRVNGRVGVSERSGGFRIVVGRGTHSEGGKGKLGPAVSKALRAEGWRIENEGAAILVKGTARR
ncbi:hypothetical protein LTR86_000151 [Recurvomyces mirabilis]|nr:hypothetical protein LTR86_000151 [Recurvomyces mirabilis]